MKNKESRIIFEKDRLILVNPKKEPVLQVGVETIILGKPIYKN